MRLNAGCGSDLRPGWMNVDVERPDEVCRANGWYPVRDSRMDAWESETVRDGELVESYFVRADLSEEWPWGVPFFSHVLMDNVLEHIPVERHTFLFREVWRNLRVGGLWEVVVPQGRRLRGSWDHVVSESLLTRDRLAWLGEEAHHLDAVKRGFPFEVVFLGPSRSWWRRLREWWNWFEPANLRVVYRKLERRG